MRRIGAHVSIAGGVENAPLNAKAIGATAYALFTKNQRQWKAKPFGRESIAAFKANNRRAGYAPEQILAHEEMPMILETTDQKRWPEEIRMLHGLLCRQDDGKRRPAPV